MQIAVLGVGLIGGSIGLAARKQGNVVAGWDVDQGVLTAAAERGAVDRAAASAADALTDAEAAFLCAPVGALPSLTAEALAAAGAGCVVTDVGSTKRALAATTADERFIGGHPIAGSEASGVEHARAELFEGAAWYLTPGARSSGVLYERLHGLLVSLGARPVAIDAEAHDRLLATVSHLPHVLANVLVSQAAADLATEGEALPRVGPSFRDTTRVAGASSGIWTDIYLANAEAIAALDRVAVLRHLRGELVAPAPIQKRTSRRIGPNAGAFLIRRRHLKGLQPFGSLGVAHWWRDRPAGARWFTWLILRKVSAHIFRRRLRA